VAVGFGVPGSSGGFLRAEEVAMMTVHVSPVNDLIEHDTETEDCVCIPQIRVAKQGDGSVLWVLVHHSLDGREIGE
jgi:hypothetical protein